MRNCILGAIAITVLLAIRGEPADAGADADPAAILHEAEAKMVANVKRAPNYACREISVREYYHTLRPVPLKPCFAALDSWRNPAMVEALRLFSVERIRLDVIMTRMGEVYAWPDVRRFEDSNPTDILPFGPFGAGAFAGYLTAIFTMDVNSFRFAGRYNSLGRELMEYQFSVPANKSHYQVEVSESGPAQIAYSGSIFVDTIGRQPRRQLYEPDGHDRGLETAHADSSTRTERRPG